MPRGPKTVTVSLPHVDPKTLRPGFNKKDAQPCAVELAVQVDYEKTEDVPDGGYWYTGDYSSKCEECGHVWTPSEKNSIEGLALEQAIEDDEDDDDGDLWDGDPDEDDDLDDEDFEDDEDDDVLDLDLDEDELDPKEYR